MSQFDPSASEQDSTTDAAVPEGLALGSLFENRFKILSNLGAGASSTVYEAEDSLLQRIVVIKIIHQFLLSSPSAVKRFKTEAVATAALSHPNIARVYGQAAAPDGRLYILMDYVKGESLAVKLQNVGKLSPAEFFDYFSQLIDALRYAHEQGVIHRDIKPSNIMLAPASEDSPARAVLLDFGLAKLLGRESEQQSATQTGVLLGTSAYMSPEQCLGNTDIDQRSDIYSLACVMYECLVGKALFQGTSSLDVMYKHLNESLRKMGALANLPNSAAPVLQKCLQKDRSLRYQSMAELRDDFEKCTSLKVDPKTHPHSKYYPGIAIFVAFLFVVILAFTPRTRTTTTSSKEEPALSIASVKKALKDPHTVRIIQNERAFDKLLTDYNEAMGRPAVEILFQRWEKMPEISTNDRMAIYRYMVTFCGDLADMTKAEFYANKARQVEGDAWPRPVEVLGRAYLKKQPDKAIELVEMIKKEVPNLQNDIELYCALLGIEGQAYLEKKEYQRSADIFELVVNNSNSHAIPEARHAQNEDRRALAIDWCKLGQSKKIPQLIAEIKLACHARSPQKAGADLGYIEEDVAKTLLESGELTYGIKLTNEAIADLDAYGKHKEAKDIYLLFPIIEACIKAKQYALAIPYQEVVLTRCAPLDLPENYYRLSVLYMHTNNPQKRLSTMEDGLKRISEIKDLPAIHIFSFQAELGMLYADNNRLDEAESFFDKAINTWRKSSHIFVPGDNAHVAQAYEHLGNVQLRKGKMEEAWASFNKSADLFQSSKNVDLTSLKGALSAALKVAKSLNKDNEVAQIQGRLRKLQDEKR